MFSLRTHIVICASLFAALIGVAILGNVLQKMGVISPPTGNGKYVAMGLYFALFIAFGLSAIPVIVKLVLGVQVQAGNENVAAVAAAIRHQNTIIWILWGVILAGLVVAIPAAIAGGMLGDEPKRALSRKFIGSSQGLLAAKPGMTYDEMVAQSTMKLDLTYAGTGISGGQRGPFDFTIPGSNFTLHGARYYYITPDGNDRTHIGVVNIGVSPEKMPLHAIDSADAALATLLTADGWLAGHEAYKTEEDQRMHGSLTRGPEGRQWLKDGIVLTISRKRMDDAVAGEDPATAGEWIQYIDLWMATQYPSFERYVFQPPGKS